MSSHCFLHTVADRFDSLSPFDRTGAVEPLEGNAEWRGVGVAATYSSGVSPWTLHRSQTSRTKRFGFGWATS
jgi:hypothetical protein